jgi:hypothetical protein
MQLLIKNIKLSMAVFIVSIVSACSSPSVNDYMDNMPNFDVLNFFNGKLEAKGVVIDRSGLVTRRFNVKMLGTLRRRELTLQEWFDFDDGEKTQRTWVITKNSDGSYTGSADDIVGSATGESAGMALRWDYEMDLAVDGSVYRVLFDDWLYRIDDKNVINRSVIKKLGFNVGEVILSIRKI